MGMRLAEVYALTPEELSPILEAWAERDEERRRERWEQTRLLAYFATLPYQKKGRRFRPQDLLPFPCMPMRPHGGVCLAHEVRPVVQ